MPIAGRTMTTPFDRDTVARVSERVGDPAWLRERRLDAFDRFDALPWPDQSGEEWRHTDIRGLDLAAFDPMPAAHPPVAGLDDLPDAVRGAAIGDRGDRLGLAVQLDADVVHRRLAPALADAGVLFETVAAAGDGEAAAKETFGSGGVSEHEAKLYWLNAAFASPVTLLYVPRGVVVEKPIQSVRWLTAGGVAVFPRVIIVAEEASSVTYIDHYGSDALDAPSLAVASVEIYAHQAANVGYLAVQDWSQDVWHFGIQRAIVARDATVRSLAATLGGKLSRSVVQSVLDGQGAHAEMLGVYFGDHEQHVDNRTLQLHRAPDTSSDLYYKGALKDRSRAIYSGLVDIEKDARRADAQQSNRNLLLSPGASADPNPFLEIKTSEVARATHGVSVGRPDEDVLFYLLSRGVDRDTAQRLFVMGFFQEVIDRVAVPEIRATLEAAVEAELAEE